MHFRLFTSYGPVKTILFMAQNESKFVLPINLLTEGRSAIVIGGGRIAYRKAYNLVASGLKVTVVARAFGPYEWDSILCERILADYSTEHINGANLVIAATDNSILNLGILDDARKAGALCNLVDSGWSEGDFITPAVVRTGGITLGITTGGVDCRKSKRIKEHLLSSVSSIAESKTFSFSTPVENQTLIELLLCRLNCISDYSVTTFGNTIRIDGTGNLSDDDFKLFHLATGGINEISY